MISRILLTIYLGVMDLLLKCDFVGLMQVKSRLKMKQLLFIGVWCTTMSFSVYRTAIYLHTEVWFGISMTSCVICCSIDSISVIEFTPRYKLSCFFFVFYIENRFSSSFQCLWCYFCFKNLLASFSPPLSDGRRTVPP